MQAIVTKYLGATNHKSSRIKASSQAGSIIISWDDALDVNENHDRAALALATKWGWVGEHYGNLIGGALPSGEGNCYVFVKVSK